MSTAGRRLWVREPLRKWGAAAHRGDGVARQGRTTKAMLKHRGGVLTPYDAAYPLCPSGDCGSPHSRRGSLGAGKLLRTGQSSLNYAFKAGNSPIELFLTDHKRWGEFQDMPKFPRRENQDTLPESQASRPGADTF